MKAFSRNELLVTGIILVLIFTASFYNFRIALRRARDAQRRADLSKIAEVLSQFKDEFGFFPLSSNDGRIIACKGENFDSVVSALKEAKEYDLQVYLKGLAPCEWGVDSLTDLTGQRQTPFLGRIPQDPRQSSGISYRYISNTRLFQIYAYLEGEAAEDGFDYEIVNRALLCGDKICNYGKSYNDIPLDKSIEEYENELMEKARRLQNEK